MVVQTIRSVDLLLGEGRKRTEGAIIHRVGEG